MSLSNSNGLASGSEACVNYSIPSVACNIGLGLHCGKFRLDVFNRKIANAGMGFDVRGT